MDRVESLAGGVVPEPTVPEACPARPEPRETEASMVWLGFQVKKDTEAKPDPLDLLVDLARTERGEMMERSDQGDFLVNRGPVVCWDQKDLRDLQDHLVLPAWTANPDPKETSDLKESQALLDSKAIPVPRDSRGPKEPLDHPEIRVPSENQVCQECRERMAHRVTPERKDLPETKDTWDPLALKDPSVIPVPEA